MCPTLGVHSSKPWGTFSNKSLTMTYPSPPSRPRHSRRPLAGIHVDLGFWASASQGQGGFPVPPLGNDGVVGTNKKPQLQLKLGFFLINA